MQRLSDLPDSVWDFAWPVLLLCVLGLAWRFPYLRFIGWLAAGFLWALWHACLVRDQYLPAQLEGVELEIEGHIASIPQRMGRYTRFEFDIRRLQAANQMAVPALPMRVRLNWYEDVAMPVAGDGWRFTVKLNRPHGFMNPGGQDYEAWLYDQGIRATGYIRKSTQPQHLSSGDGRYALTWVRQALIQSLTADMRDLQHAGILLALSVGERADISAQQWALLNATGTSHLVSISGMNVGLMAGIGFALALMVWRLLMRIWPRIGLYCSAKTFAWMCALWLALFYSALSGFALPTVRALIMLGVVVLGILLQRELRPYSSLMMALLAVLLVDPFAINSPGFWLSYVAVAVLVFILSYRPAQVTGLWQWLNIQLIMTLTLLPLTMIWFQRAAVFGALANIMAIPLTGFLVGPLALLGAIAFPLSEPLAHALFYCANFLLEWIFFPVLSWLSQIPLSSWERATPPLWTWLPVTVGMILLIAPRGLPARWLGLLLLLPLFWMQPVRPLPGEIWFSLLDVGQGLATVVQTREHTLVYDTGPRFSEDFDTGRAVLIPFLRNQGITHLDMLMISHGDNDHAGGAASVVAALPPDRLLSSEPDVLALSVVPVEPCTQGLRWVWDSVQFEILHPPPEYSARKRNNHSCVLKIAGAGGVVLLPGDIEREAEQYLLQQSKTLKADILVAPHHGSRTSSTWPFVQALAPRYIVFATGYRNRYRFPAADVVARYQSLGAEPLVSAQTGALLFRLAPRSLPVVELYRVRARRYWHRWGESFSFEENLRPHSAARKKYPK